MGRGVHCVRAKYNDAPKIGSRDQKMHLTEIQDGGYNFA